MELTKNFRQNFKGQDEAVRQTNAAPQKRNTSLERAAKKDAAVKDLLHLHLETAQDELEIACRQQTVFSVGPSETYSFVPFTQCMSNLIL